MRRKLFDIFLLLLSLALFVLFGMKSGEKSFNSLQADMVSLDRICAERTSSDENLLKSLSFNGNALFYDEAGNRWFYSIIANDQNWMNPKVSFDGVQANTMIAFADTPIATKESVDFIVYTPKQYYRTALVATTLPLIAINSDGTFSADADTEIHFRLFDNRPDVQNRFTLADGRAHYRGMSSLNYPKKPFKLTLDRKTSKHAASETGQTLLGLRADGDWHLYPGYTDPEKVRNVFSSQLWFDGCAEHNRFGIRAGMEYRYVELFLNGSYWGLYALGFPVDAKQLHIVADNRGEYEEFLFKKRAWGTAEYTDVENEGFELQVNVDESQRNYAFQCLRNYYSMMMNTDAEHSEELLYHNDIDNMIDAFLFTNLIQGDDTVKRPVRLRNMFIAMKRDGNQRVFLYIPWDLDTTWGTGFRGNKTVYQIAPNDNSFEMQQNPIWFLIKLGNPRIVPMIREQYAELRASGWSDRTIEGLLDRYETEIFDSGAFAREMERWPEAIYTNPEGKLDTFRNYVYERLKYMDEYVAGL